MRCSFDSRTVLNRFCTENILATTSLLGKKTTAEYNFIFLCFADRGDKRHERSLISFLALYFVYIFVSFLHTTVPNSEFSTSLASFPISLHQATWHFHCRMNQQGLLDTKLLPPCRLHSPPARPVDMIWKRRPLQSMPSFERYETAQTTAPTIRTRILHNPTARCFY